MSSELLDTRLRELRSSFDQSFALPAVIDEVLREDFLEVRIGKDRYLLPVAKLAGLRHAPHVLKVPTSASVFVGIVRERSQLLPVFDLCALLGGEASAEARWLALPRSAAIGLAFDAFEGHLRVPSTALLSAPIASSAVVGLFAGAVVVHGSATAILDVQAILNRVAAFERPDAVLEKS